MSDTPTPVSPTSATPAKKSTFTPGPWKMIWEEPPFVQWAGWKIKRDDDVQFPIAMVTQTVGGAPRSPQEANARLITAAPDLFAVVRDFKIYTDGLSAGQPQNGALLFELYHRMGAALTKATGLPPDQFGPAPITIEEELARR